MNLRRWLSAGSAGSVVVGVLLMLGLVSAGVTREAPIGRIAGSVLMQENGKALPDAEIVLRPVVEPKVFGDRVVEEGLPRYRYARTEEDGTFAIRNVAAGKYMIEAYGQAHDMEPMPVEVLEGKVNEFRLELKPRAPYLDLYASQSVFQPSESIDWDLHGFVEATSIKVELFRLRFDAVLREGTLYGALAPLARRDGAAKDPASFGDLVHTEERATEGRDVEGTFRLKMKLDPQKEGIYWVRCSIGGLSQGAYFSVTNLGLVTKRIGAEVLTFATKLDSGAPVPGTEVGFVKSGAFVSAGRTDANGLARFRLPADMPSRNSVIIGRQGSSNAFIDFYVNEHRSEQTRIYMYTDRPVYRPGDEVSFKGLIRTLRGTQYQVPAGGPVQIEIRDPNENLIERQTLTANARGSFSGKFTTESEADPGPFRIEAKFAGAEGDANVMVAAYRKPNYTVKVRPEKEHYIRGERVRMVVECQYYFGGPVGGAKIEGYVSRAPLFTYEYDGEVESYSYGGEYFTDVEAVTDENGRAYIEFDSRLPEESDQVWDDAEYELTASVADDAGAYFEGKGKTVVSAGAYSVTAEPSHWVVEKNAPFDVKFETLEPGNRRPIGGKSLDVVAGYEFWDGQETEFKVFARKSITTGPDGKATVVITPFKGGNVVVKATSRDDRGNEIVAETSVWSSAQGSDGYRSEESGTFVVRLDKAKYEPGESAKLLIQAPTPGATALVTIEGDRLYQVQTVKLEGATTTVDLKVRPEHAPNVFVSVCYVQDKLFQSRQRTLLVNLGKRLLDVKVTSDKATYLPGETATYAIETRNEDGRPVSADVSLAVVDESIFAIREDDTDLVEGFYPMRYNEVETSYSFTTLYLDGGDKAPPAMEIRRDFKDTAYWNPFIQTDANGRARVSFKLPDNLTTWRATVQAIDASSAVGEGVSKAVARKPLMVRLQSPAFYVAGDVVRLPASVTNQTGREAEVNVELTLVGATTSENRRKSIRLKDGATGVVEWPVTAGDPGEAAFVARAWVDSATTDGVESKVRILPRGRKAQESFNGDIRENTTLRVNVDSNADRTTGGITLSLSPTIAAPLFQSLDDLIDFPYGCVEQTMSRFMPATVAMQVAQQMNLPMPSQAAKMPQIVAESYARLGKMQHYDGSWGWWEYDSGNVYMTAYVLEGVYRARLAGYPDQNINLPNALKWAETKL
ncbi:MAG TPA: MG2 domain-containing protein, partial [Fimbriimonadaceae bacterium]|nr:MG2 domain-containing protein [Fimbriimonadaceae bacterium]